MSSTVQVRSPSVGARRTSARYDRRRPPTNTRTITTTPKSPQRGRSSELPTSSKIFTNINTTVIDPKSFDPRSFQDVKAPVCIVPPNSFALARTVEYFRIPRDVLTVCLGKSTYARCGIIVNVTPFEPEWEGTATLEISNTTPLPAKIYANEGIAQVLFFQSDEPCTTSYADKKGKYQAQRLVTLPKIG